MGTVEAWGAMKKGTASTGVTVGANEAKAGGGGSINHRTKSVPVKKSVPFKKANAVKRKKASSASAAVPPSPPPAMAAAEVVAPSSVTIPPHIMNQVKRDMAALSKATPKRNVTKSKMDSNKVKAKAVVLPTPPSPPSSSTKNALEKDAKVVPPSLSKEAPEEAHNPSPLPPPTPPFKKNTKAESMKVGVPPPPPPEKSTPGADPPPMTNTASVVAYDSKRKPITLSTHDIILSLSDFYYRDTMWKHYALLGERRSTEEGKMKEKEFADILMRDFKVNAKKDGARVRFFKINKARGQVWVEEVDDNVAKNSELFTSCCFYMC